MDRSNTALEVQVSEIALPNTDVVTFLSDLQLSLIGGGIGDTTL